MRPICAAKNGAPLRLTWPSAASWAATARSERPLGGERTSAGDHRLLGLDGDEHAAVRIEPVSVGHAPARLVSRGADDREGRRGASADEGALVRRRTVDNGPHEGVHRGRTVALAGRAHNDGPGARRGALDTGREHDVTRNPIPLRHDEHARTMLAEARRAAPRAVRWSMGVTLHTP